ncbi:MAG: AI-2E family transporter [Kofleriaceae bacterium]|nr:AI-2E family transporter [Kofleriaceae bacterium]MBP6841191.1 AI-2E family transporter [Kofleriaceae bacterium]MBP9205822.1 AI-2E family transporter [Kofleriaceae bacterium]
MSKPTDPAAPGDGVPTGPVEPLLTAPTQPLPVRRRSAPATLFGDSSPTRRFLSRWGLPLFVLLVLVIGRRVLLPFVFAGLIAYILAPIVARMSERKDGTLRMPRGLAIVICYVVFIAAVTGFMFILVPRLASDVQRIGKEAPVLYRKVNDEWTPALARWLERRFPSLAPAPVAHDAQPVVADVPLPPSTAFTMTPLPDGTMALQLSPGGVDLQPLPGGGYRLLTNETVPPPQSLEDKLRDGIGKVMVGLQSKLDDVVRFGQRLVGSLVRGVFTFFLTLMIGAFILIDREKVHAFLRTLFPPQVRGDYDVIIAGIDRGLSGVIRGQLLICLVNGVLTYIGLVIFGVKYSLILGVVAAVMSLIPIFGSILSTIPIVVAALVSGNEGLDVFRAVMATLWIVGIHFLEANILNPKIIGTAAKIHPVLVIFSLILGEHSYGLVGALLAVPVLSSIQVVFMYFYHKPWIDPADPRRAGDTQPPPIAAG